MSGKLSRATLLLLALLFQFVLAQYNSSIPRKQHKGRYDSAEDDDFPEIACPDLFSYAQNLTTDDYYGELIIEREGTPPVLDVEVNMTVHANTEKNIKVVLLSDQTEVLEGTEIKYGVTFPMQRPLPKLMQVKFNDEVICSAEPDPLKPNDPQTAMWAKMTINLGSGLDLTTEGSDYHLTTDGADSSGSGESGSGSNEGTDTPGTEGTEIPETSVTEVTESETEATSPGSTTTELPGTEETEVTETGVTGGAGTSTTAMPETEGTGAAGTSTTEIPDTDETEEPETEGTVSTESALEPTQGPAGTHDKSPWEGDDGWEDIDDEDEWEARWGPLTPTFLREALPRTVSPLQEFLAQLPSPGFSRIGN